MIACNECGGPSTQPADGCKSPIHGNPPVFGRLLLETNADQMANPRAFIEAEGKVLCEVPITEARVTMRAGTLATISVDFIASMVDAESHEPGI